MRKAPVSVDLTELLPYWEVSLKATRKSPATIKSYTTGVRAYLDWCASEGAPPVLDKAQVRAFTAGLLDSGLQASTVTARQLGVRRFSAWLADEGEIPDDPLLGVKSPKIDTKVIEPLTDDEIRALIKACKGTTYRDRRDEAIIRLMMETGLRAGEVVSLALDDVSITQGTAIIRRGKGGKGRPVPFSAKTAEAIGRYMRMRRTHKLADSPALWLGDRNRGFTYDALHFALRGRADLAGIDRFHPHLLRHTAAHRWLAAGGSEGGLMAIAGWSQPDMLMRYTRARASERAAAEARSLNLGEI